MLQDFVNSYNKTYHRSIEMQPNQVNRENETKVWWSLYWPKNKIAKKSVKFAFAVGDLVRISNLRRTFELQKVTVEEEQLWKVDKILKKRKRKGKKVILFKYVNFPMH